MKARPILFSGAMVRAILDGRKTQTRRVVKIPGRYADNRPPDGVRDCGSMGWELRWHGPEYGVLDVACPYGVPGDRLWVRETFRIAPSATYQDTRSACHYKADLDEPPADGCWKPSIHMPRWASRITLEVTNVRVERVQEISEADAVAEGVCVGDAGAQLYPLRAFAALWDSINAKRGYGWESNPWVWVVEFRREGDE